MQLVPLFVACCTTTSLPPAIGANVDIQDPVAQRKLQRLTADIQAKPQDPQPYIERADFWTDYMMLTRARKDVERSMAIRPTGSAYAWLAKAAAANDTGTKNAVELLDKGRKCSSNDMQGLLKVAEVYYQLKMHNQAIECDEAALKLHPGDLNITCWLARNKMRAGKYKDAIDECNYVLSKLPPWEKPSDMKGAKYETVKTMLFTLHAESYKTRGMSLVALHKYAEAVPDLSLAIGVMPTNTELLTARAEAYRKLGKPALAEKDLGVISGNKKFIFDNALFSEPSKL